MSLCSFIAYSFLLQYSFLLCKYIMVCLTVHLFERPSWLLPVFGNYEGILPKKNGRTYRECDIDYVKGNRNAKRIVYSNDGLIYYTGDHYKTFTKLY